MKRMAYRSDTDDCLTAEESEKLTLIVIFKLVSGLSVIMVQAMRNWCEEIQRDCFPRLLNGRD